MLVEVTRAIVTASGVSPTLEKEWLDPELIERVQTVEVAGLDADCCNLLVSGEWIVCVGTAEEFVKASNLVFLEQLRGGEVPAQNLDTDQLGCD